MQAMLAPEYPGWTIKRIGADDWAVEHDKLSGMPLSRFAVVGIGLSNGARCVYTERYIQQKYGPSGWRPMTTGTTYSFWDPRALRFRFPELQGKDNIELQTEHLPPNDAPPSGGSSICT